MQAEAFRRPEWIRSVFSVTEEERSTVMKNLFAYRIVRQGNVIFFSDPEKEMQLTALEGQYSPTEALFEYTDSLTIPSSYGITGITKDEVTTYGIALVNWVCIIFPFKGKVPFQNNGKRFSPGDIESLIETRLTDTPKEGAPSDPKCIYVDEHVQYMQGVQYLEQFASIFTPAGSEKTLTCSPEYTKRKNELFEQYKDQLDDPAVLARISEELVAIDKAWMKGDIGERTLISKKDFGIVRRELFGFSGGNQGFAGETIPGIKNSLSDGWDINKFPDYNNALRVASYDRGFQTAFGGYQYKQIIRATSNTQVTIDDCGVKYGIPVQLEALNLKSLLGLNIVTKEGFETLTAENSSKYLGKVVQFRSPAACKATETDYCAACVGTRLGVNKTALSGAMASVASTFQNIYMQAAHGKELLTADYQFMDDIS